MPPDPLGPNYEPTYLAEREATPAGQVERVTHGRHCTCRACAAEDWTNPDFACGMHGAGCPRQYQPWAPAGTLVSGPEHTPQRVCKHGRLARSCTECEGEQAQAKLERIDRIVADFELADFELERPWQPRPAHFLRLIRQVLDSGDGIGHTRSMEIAQPTTGPDDPRQNVLRGQGGIS